MSSRQSAHPSTLIIAPLPTLLIKPPAIAQVYDVMAMKRVKRCKHEAVIDAMQKRLDLLPEAMGIRRRTVEHVFGTLKSWMGSTHFLTKTLQNVRTEMSLSVLAYNMKRMIQIMGVPPLIAAIRT